MRLIVIGTEYTGKTALIDALYAWGESVGIHYHLDDHFSIPDQYFLSETDQTAMMGMPPVIKERFQRFQIYYHIDVMANHSDCLLGGMHIEESVYGRRYYYPNNVFPIPYLRKIESHLPKDTILLLLKARPDVIRARMAASPHLYPIVPSADIESVSAEFEEEYRQSWIERRLIIDTSDLMAETLFATFMEGIKPHLDTRDILRFQAIG